MSCVSSVFNNPKSRFIFRYTYYVSGVIIGIWFLMVVFMNSSLFRFKSFIASSHETLNDGELRLASLVLNNFSEIKKKGTAAGARAKYISSLYSLEMYDPAVKEFLFDIEDSSRVIKLRSIEIEGFRGFVGREAFDLSKKYNFLYGPNGSGKSSFCEALEFSLTGKISEAESKNLWLGI